MRRSLALVFVVATVVGAVFVGDELLARPELVVAQELPAQTSSVEFIARRSISANTTTNIIPSSLTTVTEWSCANFDTADEVYLVDEADTDLTDGYGPFCPATTCDVLGAVFGSTSRRAYVRSATAAVLRCRYLIP